MVVGTATNNCTDTATTVIKAQSCCTINIPTAFSPNSDGKNDLFGASSIRDVKDGRMNIFNRWGELIYQGKSIHERWDGSYKGVPVEIGVYQYYFSYECNESGKLVKTGQVMLVR